MMNLGEKLKKLRLDNDYTQAQISIVLDVKREMISYYETNEREISTTNLEILLNFYGLTKESFFSSKESKAKLQVAYRKERINLEEFEEIAWLNNFVSNLSMLKQINAE